ncbi:MAG: Gfo/Idh/MocA family oxidoreductase [Chloroflexia bacterium]|nr:Gfo/Idh/MocA family oxidoreductase [Chloroflexia bacterium]
MPDMVKLALIGCGDVAQRDYLPEMHRLAGRAEIVAVCGRTPERARDVAARYGIPAWYDDLSQMLGESECDAVVNLTPIQTHTETTLAALAASKHVYSEKPVATTLADARRIRDEAERRGLTLVCAPSVLLFPQVRFAWDLVKSGRIGTVHAAVGRGYGGVPPWAGYPSDPSPFFARGGGPLADMGVYPLHAITGILGPAQRVSAFAAQARESFVIADGPLVGKRVLIEVADNWHLMLDFGDGRLASVTANNIARDSNAPQMELFGLEGTVSVNLLDVSAPVDTLLPEEDWTRHELPHERAAGPDHLLGVEHLVDCLTTGARPIPSIDRAIHVIEIMEAAARSAATGQAVALTTTWAHPL